MTQSMFSEALRQMNPRQKLTEEQKRVDRAFAFVVNGEPTRVMGMVENGEVDPRASFDSKLTDLSDREKSTLQTGVRLIDAAASRGARHLTKFLAEFNDLFAATGSDEKTVLMRAAAAGCEDLTRFLLPRSDPNAKSKSDETALMMAIDKGHEEVISALLEDSRVDLGLSGCLPLWQYMMWLEGGPDENGDVEPAPREKLPINLAVDRGNLPLARQLAERTPAAALRAAFDEEIEKAQGGGSWDFVAMLADFTPADLAGKVLGTAQSQTTKWAFCQAAKEALPRLPAVLEARILRQELSEQKLNASANCALALPEGETHANGAKNEAGADSQRLAGKIARRL